MARAAAADGGPEARTAATPQGAASRERILEVAMELFARHGYAATPVSAICRGAGVAPTALYWHFQSKEGLLAAALERAAGTWTERMERHARGGAGPGERLERLIAGLRELVDEHLDVLALLLATSLYADQLGEDARAGMARIHERALASLAAGVEESFGRRVPDADLVAFTVLAHLDAIALVARRDRPDVPTLDRLFEHMRRMVAAAARQALDQAEQGEAP